MNPIALQAALAAWQRAKSLHQAGMLRDAEPLYRKALRVLATSPELLIDYARLAEELGDWRAAENIWRAAAQAAPERLFGDHIGLALLQQARYTDALPILEHYQLRAPNDVLSMINLAYCHTQLGQDEDAIRTLRKAIRIRPDLPKSWESLITLLINGGDREGADAALARALTAFPDNAELRYMQMEHRLKSGDFAAGFDSFGARWNTRFVPGPVILPKDRLWDGQPFEGKLLVRAEQGIGDELLYSSLLADLQQRHADSVIDCDARLLPLFSRSLPGLAFVPRDTPEDDPRRAGYARQCLMGDLPRLFRRSIGDFPIRAGWLRPDPARCEALAQDYAQRFGRKLRVGISWRSANPSTGEAKSLALDRLLPLLSVPGVQFFSLQYGDTAAEIDAFSARSGIDIYRDPGIDPTRDLEGLAAQIAALDLVISTSNSTVHLAGALGGPVWVLLHRDKGLPWYWGYEGATVPWYPGTRLLRCRQRGEWEPVIAEAAARLPKDPQPRVFSMFDRRFHEQQEQRKFP
ncbi:MAG: tetratricopeptide repeat protein [Pseudomonadota bacterium]